MIKQGFFAVNVPFNLPMATVFDPSEDFLVVAPGVVLFRPLEWRGVTYSPLTPPLARREYPTPAEMAAYLNGLPLGACVAIYLTSDGGGGLDTLYSLVPLLADHVGVVGHATLTDLALQRGPRESQSPRR